MKMTLFFIALYLISMRLYAQEDSIEMIKSLESNTWYLENTSLQFGTSSEWESIDMTSPFALALNFNNGECKITKEEQRFYSEDTLLTYSIKMDSIVDGIISNDSCKSTFTYRRVLHLDFYSGAKYNDENFLKLRKKGREIYRYSASVFFMNKGTMMMELTGFELANFVAPTNYLARFKSKNQLKLDELASYLKGSWQRVGSLATDSIELRKIDSDDFNVFNTDTVIQRYRFSFEGLGFAGFLYTEETKKTGSESFTTLGNEEALLTEIIDNNRISLNEKTYAVRISPFDPELCTLVLKE